MFKCQGYKHVDVNWRSPVKVVINKALHVTNPESDSEEFIYLPGEWTRDYDSDEDIKGDDIEESSTLIRLEVTLVITEFIDVFFKDSTMVPLKVSPLNTEFIDVFPEDLADKLPLMRWYPTRQWLSQELVFETCHTIRWILPSIQNSKGKLISCH